MNKLMTILQKILMPVANKLNANRYIRAMRDGFILSLPYTMVGSLLVSIINIPALANVMPENVLNAIKTFVSPMSVYSNSIIAIFVVIGIAYSLGNYYKINALHSAAVSLVVFLMQVPTFMTASESGEVVANAISMDLIGPKAIFTAIFLAIISTELYRWAVQHKLTIKLPDNVPASIQDSFTSFIPAGIAMLFGAVLCVGFASTSYGNMTNFIFTMFQSPLTKVTTGLGGTLIAGIFLNLFWFFGLHGQTMVSSVYRPFWDATAAENLAALEAGLPLPNLVNRSFVFSFVYLGFWIAIPLLCALFIYRKKRKDWAEVAKISLIPGLFNIYEPLMFGFPLVLNPFMLIPMILTPILSTLVGYFATVLEIIPYTTGVAMPMTTPVGLAGMLSTNSLMGGLIQIAMMPILTLMWLFFLKIQDKSEREQGLYIGEEEHGKE